MYNVRDMGWMLTSMSIHQRDSNGQLSQTLLHHVLLLGAHAQQS